MKYSLLKLFGLTNSKIELDSSEKIVINSLEFSEQFAIDIKQQTGNSIEGLYELQEFENYLEEPKLRGIKSVLSEKLDVPTMYKMVKKLQSDDLYKGYHIFCCGGYASATKYFIAAIKSFDQFECLRIFETNGINYNVTTEDVVEFLQKWYHCVKFSIIDVSPDTVVIQLEHLNFDLDKFARESIEFCPDFSAAVEDEDQMKQYIIERNGEVDFWWD